MVMEKKDAARKIWKECFGYSDTRISRMLDAVCDDNDILLLEKGRSAGQYARECVASIPVSRRNGRSFNDIALRHAQVFAAATALCRNL